MAINLPGTKSRDGRVTGNERKWKIFWSYLPDWVLTIFLWGIFYLLDKIDGYRRVFSITDTSLAHPHADPERIPVWMLAIICGLVPLVVIILTAALVQRSFWDAHNGILGLLLDLALSQTLTMFIKITVGRPRPDLLDRCQPPDSLTSNPIHGLTSWTVCTRTDLLQDGFRSFPSGHASFSWAGMWYLILYGAAKMRVNNRRGYTWKAWALLAPLTCAILVAVSRSMDYRHHATDLIAGAIVGVLSAWVGYRSYYPPLGHPQAYKPYSPRIPSDNQPLPLHNQPSNEHSQFLPSNSNGISRQDQNQAQWAASGQSHRLGNGTANANGHMYPPQVLMKQDTRDDGDGYTTGRTGEETVQRGS